MNATGLLGTLSSLAASQVDTRQLRLATIDPAYSVGTITDPTFPLVTFDGEATMSTKQYPMVDGYVPVPSARVAMAPIGTTYLILGSISDTPAHCGVVASQILTASSTGYTATGNTDFVLSSVPVLGTRNYRIHLSSAWALTAAAQWYMELHVDGSRINRLGDTSGSSSSVGNYVSAGVLWRPSTGTYTLRVNLIEGTGTATFTFIGASDVPRQFWVEDIGPR